MSLDPTLVMPPRFRKVLERCRPYILVTRENRPFIDERPFGLEVPPELILDPMSLRAARFLDHLEKLDALSFGPHGMPMPRWVFYDCAEVPTAIFGFVAEAKLLAPEMRHSFGVPYPDDTPIPVSMYMAVPTLDPHVFFGHNLSSVGRSVCPHEGGMPGLGTVTKAFCMKMLRITSLVAATQWDSAALHIHIKFGPVAVVTAYTPAHTFPRTLTYRHEVTDETLRRVLAGHAPPPTEGASRTVRVHDDLALQALQEELEHDGTPYRYRVATGPLPDEAGQLEVRVVRSLDPRAPTGR